jgi:RNA polymerase sigma-70 factor (ECF subfamily)
MGTNVLDIFATEAIPHMQALRRTARRLVGCPADAEDLVQETYLRAYRWFHRYRPGSNIRAWLYTIMHRARTDALRRAGRRVRTVPLHGDGPTAPPGPETRHFGQEELARALGRLPEAFREAVLLRDVHDLSYEEIARILRIPAGTVMSRIYRGRTRLRRDLEGTRRGSVPGIA